MMLIYRADGGRHRLGRPLWPLTPMAFPITPESKPALAQKKIKYEFAGVGALVQLIGFVAVWFFPLGTFAGVALLIIGSAMSKKILCSECGN